MVSDSFSQTFLKSILHQPSGGKVSNTNNWDCGNKLTHSSDSIRQYRLRGRRLTPLKINCNLTILKFLRMGVWRQETLL